MSQENNNNINQNSVNQNNSTNAFATDNDSIKKTFGVYQDNGFQFFSYNLKDISEYATKAAFPNIDLYDFFSKLNKIEITKSQYSLNNVTEASALDPAVQEQILTEINNAQNALFENHFTLVYLMLMGFIAIDTIFEKTPTIELLRFKNSIENIAVLYQESTSNKVISYISQEFSALRIVNSLLYVISSFNKYYTSSQYLQTAASEASAAGVAVVKFNKDDCKYAESFLMTPRNSLEIQDKKSDKSKGDKKVNVIKIEDIPEMDFTQPATTLSKISDSLTSVMNDSNSTITTLQTTLLQYKLLNVVFALTESDRKMNIIRSKLDQLKNSMSASAIPSPMFSIVSVCKFYTFRCEPQQGRVIYSLHLMPNETRELRQKTTEMTEEKRQKTSSIFDSMSQDTSDSFNNTLNNENSTSNNSTANVTNSIEQKTEVGAKFNITANAGIPKADNVKTSLDGNVSSATNTNNSNEINNTREQSNTTVANAVQNHSKNVSANRDISMTENAESTTQTTQENSSVITFENPNSASILNIDFCLMHDVYFCVYALVDIRVMFSNGTTYEESSVQDMQNLLDKYVQPELHNYLKNYAFAAGTVTDYADDDIHWIKMDANGNLSMKKDIFSNIAKDYNLVIALDDMQHASEVIHGIPLSYYYASLPAQGQIAAVGSVGQPLLDSNEQRLMEQKINIMEAQALSETSQAQLIQQKLNFNEQVFTQKIMTMDAKDVSEHFFLNFANPGDYFSKPFIINMIKDTFKRDS